MKIRPAGETHFSYNIEKIHKMNLTAETAKITFKEYEFEDKPAFYIFINDLIVGNLPATRVNELKKHLAIAEYVVSYFKCEPFIGDDKKIVQDVVFGIVFEK